MGKQSAIATQLQITLANCPSIGPKIHSAREGRLLQAGKSRNTKQLKISRNENFAKSASESVSVSINGLLEKADYPGETAVKWLQNECENRDR